MKRPASIFDHYETRRKLPHHLNGEDSVTLVSHPSQQRRHLCVASPGNPLTVFCLLKRMRGGLGGSLVERSHERPRSLWLGCVTTKERLVTTIDSLVTVSVRPCPNDGGQRWGGGSSERLGNRCQLALGRRGGDLSYSSLCAW